MTEKFNTTPIYKVDHTKFGGLICISDFNTDHRGKNNTNGSPIANRIISDWKFDKRCLESIKITERNKQYGK